MGKNVPHDCTQPGTRAEAQGPGRQTRRDEPGADLHRADGAQRIQRGYGTVCLRVRAVPTRPITDARPGTGHRQGRHQDKERRERPSTSLRTRQRDQQTPLPLEGSRGEGEVHSVRRLGAPTRGACSPASAIGHGTRREHPIPLPHHVTRRYAVTLAYDRDPHPRVP